MEDYDGSPELDVDLELLSVYEKRLERAIRVKDKVRRLARHHKVYLTDVNKLHDNVERARLEAKSALEAKKRMLQQAIERRFDEAIEAVDDEIQAKKMPLDQAASDIKRSSAVLDAALETLEDKLKEPQHDFIQRFVPMVEDIESHVSHAMALRKEYDVLVDDDLVLAAVDDFCRLTVRHRVRKAGALSSPFDAGDARAESMDSLESKQAVPRPRRHSPGKRDIYLSKNMAKSVSAPNDHHGKYLSKRLAAACLSDTPKSGKPAHGEKQASDVVDTEQLRSLVTDAYHELEDLYSWLKQHGVSEYSIAGRSRSATARRRAERLRPAAAL